MRFRPADIRLIIVDASPDLHLSPEPFTGEHTHDMRSEST